MADDAPSWLNETPDAPAVTVPTTPAEPAASAPAPAPKASKKKSKEPAQDVENVAPASPQDLAEMEKDQLKGIILFTRLLNLGTAIAVITHGILKIVNVFKSPQIWILGLYSCCGGCLICCLESQLKMFGIRTAISMNFGFLFNPIFRFLYYIMLATLCWSLEDLFGKILAGVLVGVAVYNTFVLIKFPAYRKLRDELAKEEDKRIEGKIRDNARQQAMNQMFSK